MVGTWRDKLQWYRNSGTRAEPEMDALADSALVTIPRGTNAVPTFADIDGDGLVDLMIGTASGRMRCSTAIPARRRRPNSRW